MPFYRQLGSIPRKRHIAHRREPGYRGEGIYYEEVVTTAGFGRAYSIVYHLRPPTRVRKIEAAGAAAVETVEQPTCCGITTSRSGAMPAGRRPDHRPRAAADQRRRDARPLPAGPAAGRAVPQRRRRRGALRPQGPRHAAHHVRRAAVPAVRLRRHPALHDLSARVRRRRRSPICWSSRRPATSPSRRATSTPTASFASAPLTPSATCTARASRSSSTARRT